MSAAQIIIDTLTVPSSRKVGSFRSLAAVLGLDRADLAELEESQIAINQNGSIAADAALIAKAQILASDLDISFDEFVGLLPGVRLNEASYKELIIAIAGRYLKGGSGGRPPVDRDLHDAMDAIVSASMSIETPAAVIHERRRQSGRSPAISGRSAPRARRGRQTLLASA